MDASDLDGSQLGRVRIRRLGPDSNGRSGPSPLPGRAVHFVYNFVRFDPPHGVRTKPLRTMSIFVEFAGFWRAKTCALRPLGTGALGSGARLSRSGLTFDPAMRVELKPYFDLSHTKSDETVRTVIAFAYATLPTHNSDCATDELPYAPAGIDGSLLTSTGSMRAGKVARLAAESGGDVVRDSHNGSKKQRLARLVALHAAYNSAADCADYPYPRILPLAKFEAVADELGLCRQQRRVTMGRVLNYPLPEVARRMELSLGTVRDYDRAARERALCQDGGELVRLVHFLMFSRSDETSEA